MPRLYKTKAERLLIKDNEGNELLFDFEKIEKLKTVASAIQNLTRVAIINVISLKGEVSASDIHQKLKIEQSTCSQHLFILKKTGVVLTRKMGKYIFYSINPNIKWITQIDPDKLMAA